MRQAIRLSIEMMRPGKGAWSVERGSVERGA